MNCFTVHGISYGSLRLDGEVNLQELMTASWTPIREKGLIGPDSLGLKVGKSTVWLFCAVPL